MSSEWVIYFDFINDYDDDNVAAMFKIYNGQLDYSY